MEPPEQIRCLLIYTLVGNMQMYVSVWLRLCAVGGDGETVMLHKPGQEKPKKKNNNKK